MVLRRLQSKFKPFTNIINQSKKKKTLMISKFKVAPKIFRVWKERYKNNRKNSVMRIRRKG